MLIATLDIILAPGQEVVRFQGIPVWNMAYNGGMLPEFHGILEMSKSVYSFLKQALLRGINEGRFARGPPVFMDDDFVYVDNLVGDITRFKGTERLFSCRREVFSQDYIGGLIVHK